MLRQKLAANCLLMPLMLLEKLLSPDDVRSKNDCLFSSQFVD